MSNVSDYRAFNSIKRLDMFKEVFDESEIKMERIDFDTKKEGLIQRVKEFIASEEFKEKAKYFIASEKFEEINMIDSIPTFII